MLRNIIFDWSGTLIDDLPAVWKATNHVLLQAGVEAMSLETFREEFRLPFQGFYERFTPHVELRQLEEWYHTRFREIQHTVKELPHARGFLEFCRRQSCRTFLLSTIHRDHFAAQVSVNGFDQLIDRPYVEAWNKKEWIHRVLNDNGLNPLETLFVGDMEHDVETAHHAGIFSCAVLTGYSRVDQLRRGRPHLIVEHLGELQTLLELGGFAFPPPAHTPASRVPISTVGALIFDDQSRVLMVKTHKWSHRWGIPGGKIQWGERAEDALKRELKEETDLDVEEIRFVLVQDCIHSTEFYRDAHFVLLNYTCRVRGAVSVVLNDEAQAFRWLTARDALSLDLNQPTRLLLEQVLAGAAVQSYG